MGSSVVLEAAPRTPSTFTSALRFGLISLLAYAFSFGKSLVVAHLFGTGADMDAFTLAVLLPNLLASLLTGGFAISLVPALMAAELKGREARANTFRVGLFLFATMACILAVILAVFSYPTMGLIAPNFDGPKRLLGGELLRWNAALLPLNAVYAFCSAELLSRKRYIAVAAAPVISTAVSVTALVLFSSMGVKVLALGLVGGAAFQALAVTAPAWRANPLGGVIHWWTAEVRELARQQLPLLLISSFGVVNLSVDQFMAGLLPPGAAAALSFASNLNMVVTQVVVMAASWVVLPELSKLAAEGDDKGLAFKVHQSIYGIALLAIPVAMAIMIIGTDMVRILFEHGRFDSSSTRQVSAIWIGYTCGLLPFALGMVPVRLLNALRKNHFLVRVGLTALVVNAGLDYLLMKWLGPIGISLSTSLVYFCTSILVFWFARGLMPGIFERKLRADILRALVVCVPAGVGLFAIQHMCPGVIAVLVGGGLFAAMVLCLYQWCGMIQVPFKKYWAVRWQ